VIEQESGYDPDPEVPGLGPMALAELQDELDALGAVAPSVGAALLDVSPEGASLTFRQQLAAVRTEQQLDRTYRELVAHHRSVVPGVADAVLLAFPNLVERHNPVATVGSMQVATAWVLDHPERRGAAPEQVRDELYTLEGGVRFGTLRLFSGADYDDPLYRFADFNAGPYASRNAAFQQRIADLSGVPLATDGDLLQYRGSGRARWHQDGETLATLQALAPELGLTPARVRRDLRHDKAAELERTATWRAVSAAWSAEHGPVRYAAVPSVTLDSPKLSGTWTTATFAERTERRYRACRKR